jgi:hypothetical protein
LTNKEGSVPLPKQNRPRVTIFSLAAAVACLLACLVAPANAQPAGSEIQFQGVAVTLNPEGHEVTGESNLIYAAGAARRVTLRLAESARVRFVEIADRRSPFVFDGGVLSLDLPGKSAPLTVTISYSASFNDRVAGGPGAGEDPSYGVNGAITQEGSFLGDGAYWYPVPSQVPARRLLKVTAPAGTEAVSYGRRVSRETSGAVTRSVWEEARPVGALTLCAGPYRIEESSANGIPVYSYLYPGNSSLSSRYLEAAARYLVFYSELLGPYPFEKFAVVENYFPTGYGFPSFTLLGGTVIRLPFIVDTSLPHEIAHSWWGNGVEVDPREGNWCEGLVSYLADYYLKERRSPAEGREHRRQLLIDYASLVTPGNDFPLSRFTSRVDPSSRAIGYGKGAMVFHMIRNRIGDRAFFDALREVARERMYHSASWSDFVRAFSRSSGADLSPYMNQWLNRTGGPRLALSEVRERKEGGEWLVTGNIVQTPPLYDLPVPLRLQGEGAPVQQTVRVSGERTPFRISSSNRPRRVVLDPDAEVFRVLAPQEIPVTVNSLKGSRSLIGVITENCRCDRETFQNLLASLSQGGAPVYREKDLTGKEAAGHDLLFCGMPGQGVLTPSLPDGVEISAGSFSVAGERYQGPDALLLLVTKGQGEGRVSGVFHPLSQAAAALYAQKITHYGKFGYLAFAGGGNRAKGTLSGADGGVAVNFPR